ncbi:hypothetical protein [Nocardioides sp.]|uniref:hypothetical protein n=1 Tax=Nocardioides sp. TaxID=35761 RepID=UPI003514E8E7
MPLLARHDRGHDEPGEREVVLPDADFGAHLVDDIAGGAGDPATFVQAVGLL